MLLERGKYGLFHLKHIKYGNRISEFGNKHRRTWKPNAHFVKLYSEILDERIVVHCTSAALKAIDRKGGLDNYILKSHPKYLQSQFAIDLKERLLGFPTKRKAEMEFAKKEAARISKLNDQNARLEIIKEELRNISPLNWQDKMRLKYRPLFKFASKIASFFAKPFSFAK